MTQSPIDSLLQASLSQHQPKRPMYSVTAHALVAFFGGPVALVLFSGLSVHHIGLLRPNLKYYIPMLLGVLGVTYFMSFWLVAGWPEWLAVAGKNSSSFKLVNRFIALGLFGIIYLFQRHYFSISQMKGESSNPWVPAIAAGVIGFGIQIGILYAVGQLAK